MVHVKKALARACWPLTRGCLWSQAAHAVDVVPRHRQQPAGRLDTPQGRLLSALRRRSGRGPWTHLIAVT